MRISVAVAADVVSAATAARSSISFASAAVVAFFEAASKALPPLLPPPAAALLLYWLIDAITAHLSLAKKGKQGKKLPCAAAYFPCFLARAIVCVH